MSPRAALCGTDSGWYRHRRTTRTTPCKPCVAAHNAAAKSRIRAKARGYDDAELAYGGGWVRDGLVWRPTERGAA